MRINVLPQSLVVGSTMKDLQRPDIDPRLGTVLSVNNTLFKFTSSEDVRKGMLVKKVDLGELFADIPQSLVGIAFQDSSLVDLQQLEEALGALVDETKAEFIVENNQYEETDPADELGVYFCQWKRLVGLTALLRREVELTLDGNTLWVDARGAKLFKGSVSITIQ